MSSNMSSCGSSGIEVKTIKEAPSRYMYLDVSDMYPINVSVTSFGYMMFYIVKIHAKMSSLRYRAGLQDQDTYPVDVS